MENEKRYVPGVYSAAAQGYGGLVSVKVAVDETAIVSLEANVSCETPKLAERPRTKLVQAIVDSNSADVDGISGATMTSDAIKTAVRAALRQASSETDGPRSLHAGTYQTVAKGYGGEIRVETELSESGITAVRVISGKETPGIGREALAMMAEKISGAGSLAVDGVSGATVTSAAVKNAVSAAIREAGGEPADYMAAPPVPEKTDAVVETDVVVVGAGIAGFCAAIEALDQGADVVLLEKLDQVGGTSIIAGGAFMATNSYLNAERGDESKELADWWYERQERHYNVNYEQLLYVAQNSGELMDWIREKSGIEFQLGYGGGSHKMWSHRPVLLPEEPRNGHGTPRIIWGLRDYFVEHGGKLMCGVRAMDLEKNADGAICAVRAESTDTNYLFKVRGGVIIAAGGYEADPELVKRFAPNSVHMVANGFTAGDTGDGILMGERAGAKLVYSGYLMPSWNHIQDIGAFGLDAMNMKHKCKCIELNGRLERFYNENTTPIQEKWEFAMDGTGEFYVLFDSSLDAEILEKFDRAAQAGAVWKGSLAEVAEAAGKSPMALEAAVERWNTMAEQGEDKDFGNALIAPFDNGPYYLCRIYEMSTGSYGGLKISLDAEVMGVDGKAIPGLYASGESADGEFYYRNYVCGGTSFSMCGVFGRTAGRNAAQRARG